MTDATKGQVLPLTDIFPSAGHLIDNQISMKENEDNIADTVGLMYQKIEGQELTNWTSVKVPEVTAIEE